MEISLALPTKFPFSLFCSNLKYRVFFCRPTKYEQDNRERLCYPAIAIYRYAEEILQVTVTVRRP